jgi:hypothetical protein
MKSEEIKPKFLRNMLLVIIFILLAVSGFGFYRAQDMISQLVIEANSVASQKADLVTNSPEISSISDAETKKLADKASSLIYNAATLQSSIKNDLNSYAASAGIDITDISVQNNTLTSIYKNGAVKSEKVIVTLGSPLRFTSLMKFLKSVETNAPKIQITSLELNNTNANIGDVAVRPITMEVYVK